jgi:hypothetical protein
MVNFAKLLHDALGIESPKAFVIWFAIFGFFVFGVLGFLVSKAYQGDLRRQAESKTNVTALPVTPAPIAETRRPAVGRITDSKDITIKGLRGYGDVDGFVISHSSGIKVFDAQVIASSIDQYQELKARLTDHAGNATKIKKDFVWYRRQMALASVPASDIAKLKPVEREFRKVASNKTATLALLQQLRPVPRKK